MTTTPTGSAGDHDPGDPGGNTTTTTTTSSTDGTDGPRVTGEEMRDLGRLRRTSGNRRLGGVAGGLARHLDVDPLVLRAGFVVLVFFGGAGLILYLAGWLLVPADDTERAVLRLDPRTRSVALVVAGAVAALALVGGSAGAVGISWPIVVLGLIVLVVLASRSSQEQTDAAPVPATAGSGAWQPPQTAGQAGAPRPARPSRAERGPVLFWLALAGITFALGVLGVLDGALDWSVPDGAYPALALTVIGSLLVLGAFYGRPGGLIALGLVAALATAGASIGDDADRSLVVEPTTTQQLADDYTVSAGEITVDLSTLDDLEALDGRTLTLDVTAGSIDVLVPPGLDVVGDARIDALGQARAFGAQSTQAIALDHDGGRDAPVLTLDAEVAFGEISVSQLDRNPS